MIKFPPKGMPDINELERITVRCPKCARTLRTDRVEGDPIRAAVVEIQCERCNPGDFDSPRYFDADGKEVSWTEGIRALKGKPPPVEEGE